MSASDWNELGVGFFVSTVIVVVVGLPIIARYMPGQTVHERNASAWRALQIPAGLLASFGIFAWNVTYGLGRALIFALPVMALSLFGFLSELARQPRNRD